MIRSVTLRKTISGSSGTGTATDARINTSVSIPAEPWDAAPYLAEGQAERATGMRPTIHRTCVMPGCTARVRHGNAVRCAAHRGMRVPGEIGEGRA